MMSKRRILEIYMNVVEWGNGVFGAEAAARYYFKTGAANLSAFQAAKLAAMVPNPRYYDKHREARGLQRKTGIILARMNMVAVP
jgi:monofunctional biosynthetic peptidoglycan transglycosylase